MFIRLSYSLKSISNYVQAVTRAAPTADPVGHLLHMDTTTLTIHLRQGEEGVAEGEGTGDTGDQQTEPRHPFHRRDHLLPIDRNPLSTTTILHPQLLRMLEATTVEDPRPSPPIKVFPPHTLQLPIPITLRHHPPKNTRRRPHMALIDKTGR